MKQYKDKDLQIFLLFYSTFSSVLGTAVTNFGKNYWHTAAGESGVILIIFFLILSIFSKELRKTFWTKKGLLIILIAMVINLPFAIISLYNRNIFF